MRRLRAWLLGLVCGGLLLALALAHIDVTRAAKVFLAMQPHWAAQAMLVFGLAFALRVLRWRELMTPLRPLAFREVLKPMVVGYALNYALPARVGELFRANYGSHMLGLPGASLLGTIVVERASDLAMTLLLMAIGLLSLSISAGDASWRVLIAASVALLALPVLALLLQLTLRGSWLDRFPRARRRLHELRGGLLVVTQCRLSIVVMQSVAIACCEALAVWLLFRSCGTALPVGTLALAMSCMALSTVLPSAPGFVGAIQFALLFAMQMAGRDGSLGVAVATLVQLLLFLPLTVWGIAWAAQSPQKLLRLA
jgi:uncharacterized protein (TIRG00374 family)